MNNYSISKDLITAIEDNNLVLFIGSGLSRNFGFPNWKELVMGLLNDLSFHDKKYESLKGVLDTGIFTEIAILDKIIEMNPNNKKKVYEFLESTINKDIQELDLSLLSILNQLSTKIITTNYDKLLEISNQTYKKLTYNDTFHLSKLNEYNEFIFKLHGDIGTPESCILFTSDYEELYETKHAAIERLKSQIADKTILFIGFSFNDIYVKETFAYINEVYKSLNRTHYIITTDDINYTEYGLESIKLESYDELANLIGVLGSYKKESNGLTDRKVTNELQIAPETSVNTTKNSAAILFSNPIDLDNEYNVDNITKYFKKYNLEIDIFHLTQDSLFDLENYEYLFIFTREIQGKLVIEDDYFKSKLITLKELDNQLSILAPRGIFLIVNKEIKREDSPINLIHSQNITLPFSLHLYEENLNSLLYNILRKADINKLSSKSIYNQDFFSLSPVNRGIAKIHYKKGKGISDKIEKKALVNFIGRKTDITDIIRKTLDARDKILTIKGSGGIGKTATVKKIAYELYDRGIYKDGITFIDCEYIKDYRTFERRIAKTFELQDAINFKDYLTYNGEKLDALIILDNLEPLLYLEDINQMKNLITFISDYKKVIVTSREWIGFEFEEKHELRGFTTEEALKLFKKLYPIKLSKEEQKILKEDILEDLLNNNPLAIKIVTQNIPKSISMQALKKELISDFFNATNLGYEEIYDNKSDENIERSTSLYQSIYYSYIRLSAREQLVFEILSLFPNGIHMEYFKAFFSTEEFRTDIYRVTNKELRSLENKSIIEINGGFISLQSIIGKFADFHLNKRTEIEKNKYYKRAFSFNYYLLEIVNQLFDEISPTNAYRLFDMLEENYIKSLEYIDKINIDTETKIRYIVNLARFFSGIGQGNKYYKKLDNCLNIFQLENGGELLFNIVKAYTSYYAEEFDKAYEKLISILPFEEINQLSNDIPIYIRRSILRHALNLYALEGYEYQIVQYLLREEDPSINDIINLESFLFKIGSYELLDSLETKSKDGFFYFELMLNKGSISLEELNQYIENDIYNKQYIELMQTNYIKTKLGIKNKDIIEKLVVSNPYTMGIKDLMLALCEENKIIKQDLFESAIEKLYHIKYYYVEAIYYYCRYLKESNNTLFDEWYDLGLYLSTTYHYHYQQYRLHELLMEENKTYNEDNYQNIVQIKDCFRANDNGKKFVGLRK